MFQGFPSIVRTGVGVSQSNVIINKGYWELWSLPISSRICRLQYSSLVLLITFLSYSQFKPSVLITNVLTTSILQDA